MVRLRLRALAGAGAEPSDETSHAAVATVVAWSAPEPRHSMWAMPRITRRRPASGARKANVQPVSEPVPGPPA
jgi:hypothetical protein